MSHLRISRRGSNASAYAGSRRGSNASAYAGSRRGSNASAYAGSRRKSNAGAHGRSNEDLDEVRLFLERVGMEIHFDLLVSNGFSSLETLQYVKSADLQDLGILMGHAILIARAPKSAPKATATTRFLPLSTISEPESDDLDELAPLSLEPLDFDRYDDSGSDEYELNVFIGHDREVVIWNINSVITYWIYQEDWNEDDYSDLRKAVRRGAKDWNDARIGVTFSEARRPEDATFHFKKARRQSGNTLARSFFPDEFDADPFEAERIFIYPAFFAKRNENDGKDLNLTITHEFGHVLGLQHRTTSQRGGTRVQIGAGTEDEESIMSKRGDIKLTERDIRGVQVLYRYKNGGRCGGYPVRRVSSRRKRRQRDRSRSPVRRR